MKKKQKNKIIHYRYQSECSAEYKWRFWVSVCGKGVEQITMLTSIKENVTCKLCKRTANFKFGE